MTTDKPASVPQDGRAKGQQWPRKVRTTLEPNKVIEVGPAEYADLTAWDLIKSEGE